MKTELVSTGTGANVALTGLLLFANMDAMNYLDYAIKAAIGGAIWMVFKMGSDLFTYCLDEKKKRKAEEKYETKKL